jgi:hypothetical protein
MAIGWQSDGNQMPIRWQSDGNRMAIGWQSDGNRMAIRWQSDGNQAAVTCQSGGNHAITRCIALISETFVFIYLGMSIPSSFPLFNGSIWIISFCGLIACFLGRIHVFLGSSFINCFRNPASSPQPISRSYQCVMWFSGLRGGVAFAIASKSYHHRDFPQRCGGFHTIPPAWEHVCYESVENDGTAILQAPI